MEHEKVYDILDANMKRLEKKLTRIKNKCNKYGCDFHYEVVGEVFKDVKIGSDNKGKPIYEKRKFVQIKTNGFAIVNDWEFVGVVEHLQIGSNIVKTIIDIDIPNKYFHSEPICEHCNSNRTRKDTYLIRNTKTNEFKQVGKSCLMDFTNGLSAEAVAGYISLYDELIKGEEPYNEIKYDSYYDLSEMIMYGIEVIHNFGYTKTRNEYDEYNSDSTSELVKSFYRRFELKCKERIIDKYVDSLKREFEPLRDENKEIYKQIVEYVNGLDDSTSWNNNVKSIFSVGFVTFKDLGIALSIIPSYFRKVQRERIKQSESKSDFIGTVGDKVTLDLQYMTYFSFETMYGFTYIYKFFDNKGNIVVWKTSKGLDFETGQNVKLTGTIKSHDDYKGTKQTSLTRCKVA